MVTSQRLLDEREHNIIRILISDMFVTDKELLLKKVLSTLHIGPIIIYNTFIC